MSYVEAMFAGVVDTPGIFLADNIVFLSEPLSIINAFCPSRLSALSTVIKFLVFI